MHFQLKKTITHFTVLSALLPALSVLAAEVGAKLDPAQAPKRGQYVYDSFGVNVRSDVTRRCVGTGFWTPETATTECDPNLFASPAAPTPRAQTAEPAPTPAPAPEPAPQAAAPAPAPAEEPPTDLTSQFPPEPATEAAEAAPEPEAESAAAPEYESAAPAPGGDTISPPVVFYDGDEGVAKDDNITGRTEYNEEAPGNATDDTITGAQVYRDENEGAARDDGIIAHHIYDEDNESAAKDDNITGRTEYNEDDEGVAKDDGIVGRSEYNDADEGTAKDEGITGHQVFEEGEQSAAKDDGIIGHQVFNDENEGTTPEEGITAQSEYTEEESGQKPEDLVSEPKTAPEAAAQPEEKAPEQAAAQPEQKAPEQTAQAEQKAAPAEAQKPTPARQEQKPVTMLPVTVTVEADPLFDFDKSAIRSDSRKKLDDLVEQLKGVSYGEILSVGFADPIGGTLYNQHLSERRAAAVKQYLVDKGIAANTIRVEGRGETEEYASYSDCGGLRKQKLISCLQPDRRVEVTVTAEKRK